MKFGLSCKKKKTRLIAIAYTRESYMRPPHNVSEAGSAAARDRVENWRKRDLLSYRHQLTCVGLKSQFSHLTDNLRISTWLPTIKSHCLQSWISPSLETRSIRHSTSLSRSLTTADVWWKLLFLVTINVWMEISTICQRFEVQVRAASCGELFFCGFYSVNFTVLLRSRELREQFS